MATGMIRFRYYIALMLIQMQCLLFQSTQSQSSSNSTSTNNNSNGEESAGAVFGVLMIIIIIIIICCVCLCICCCLKCICGAACKCLKSLILCLLCPILCPIKCCCTICGKIFFCRGCDKEVGVKVVCVVGQLGSALFLLNNLGIEPFVILPRNLYEKAMSIAYDQYVEPFATKTLGLQSSSSSRNGGGNDVIASRSQAIFISVLAVFPFAVKFIKLFFERRKALKNGNHGQKIKNQRSLLLTVNSTMFNVLNAIAIVLGSEFAGVVSCNDDEECETKPSDHDIFGYELASIIGLAAVLGAIEEILQPVEQFLNMAVFFRKINKTAGSAVAGPGERGRGTSYGGPPQQAVQQGFNNMGGPNGQIWGGLAMDQAKSQLGFDEDEPPDEVKSTASTKKTIVWQACCTANQMMLMLGEQCLALLVAAALITGFGRSFGDLSQLFFLGGVVIACLGIILIALVFCCKYQRLSTGLFCKYFCKCFYNCCSTHCEKHWVRGNDPLENRGATLNPYGVETVLLRVAVLVPVQMQDGSTAFQQQTMVVEQPAPPAGEAPQQLLQPMMMQQQLNQTVIPMPAQGQGQGQGPAQTQQQPMVMVMGTSPQQQPQQMTMVVMPGSVQNLHHPQQQPQPQPSNVQMVTVVPQHVMHQQQLMSQSQHQQPQQQPMQPQQPQPQPQPQVQGLGQGTGPGQGQGQGQGQAVPQHVLHEQQLMAHSQRRQPQSAASVQAQPRAAQPIQQIQPRQSMQSQPPQQQPVPQHVLYEQQLMSQSQANTNNTNQTATEMDIIQQHERGVAHADGNTASNPSVQGVHSRGVSNGQQPRQPQSQSQSRPKSQSNFGSAMSGIPANVLNQQQLMSQSVAVMHQPMPVQSVVAQQMRMSGSVANLGRIAEYKQPTQVMQNMTQAINLGGQQPAQQIQQVMQNVGNGNANKNSNNAAADVLQMGMGLVQGQSGEGGNKNNNVGEGGGEGASVAGKIAGSALDMIGDKL